MTQEDLAEAATLSTRTVSDLERGVNRTAHKDTAKLLADALGLEEPVHRLFVAAARGRASVTEVLAARAEAPVALAAVALATSPEPAAVAGPSASPGPVPHELPADVDAFTGRVAELAELDWLLPPAGQGPGAKTGPVVISAVSGTAGVGKTALAVRWAHRVADSFPDGQLYVNLRGYDPDQPVTPGEALASFLRSLGIAGSEIPLSEAERAAFYRSAVAGKRLLIMLDNAATVEQVRPLLPGSASVMVVVTSRDALAGLVALDGARRLDVGLLSATDAAALLRNLIGKRAEADPAATDALVGLCARLPLALRVAAELAVHRQETPLAELAAELADLEDRLELLDAGGDPRGAVASVFSWSYRHLAPAAARMFRLLGLHPGGHWDRYAAAALTSTTVPEARRLLGVLARAHLIQAASTGRYEMHDLLRAYAVSLAVTLDEDESRQAALSGLFDYYLAACATATSSLVGGEQPQPPSPSQTRLGIPDLGDRATARAWLDTELATLPAVTAHTAGHGWPHHTIRLADTLRRYLYGDHNAEGLTIHLHALNAARDCGDRAAQAHALTTIGCLHDRQSSHEIAADYHQQALTLARDIGDRRVEARALGNLAIAHDEQGRYRQAADLYRQALTIFRELGDQMAEAMALANLGEVCYRQGSYQEAADLQKEVSTLLREIGQHPMPGLLIQFAELGYRQSRYQQAAGLLRQALAGSREVGDQASEAEALTRLGEIANRQGHHDQAAAYHQQALVKFRETGDRDGEADALNGAGETLLAIGQPEQARTCHTTALTLTRQTGNRRQQARALTRLGDVCHRQDEDDQASEHHRQALAIYQEIGDPGGEADALNGTGESLFASGRSAEAHTHHTSALDLACQTGDLYEQARAHRGLASTCQAVGQQGEARKHRERALDIYTTLGVPEASHLRASTPLPRSPAGTA